MSWNANGLIKHKNELEIVLNTKKIDICLISETHLTSHTFLNIKNYEIYYTNHPNNNARGGSAVIIKSTIKHHEETRYCSEEFQITTVSILLQGSEVWVSAIYSPPRHNIKYELYKYMLNKYKGKFIIGGDFNAKNTHWGSRLTTTKGRELLKAANDMGCDIISTGKPTYWPTDTNKKPDLIDFFIVRQICKNKLYVHEGYELNSDHSPIYITVNIEANSNVKQMYLCNKQTDWTYFKTKLCDVINVTNQINTVNILESEVELITTQIQHCAWISTPEQSTNAYQQHYPKDILDLIKIKRKIRKKWQRTRQPTFKTELNYVTKCLQEKTREFRNKSFTKHVAQLTPDKNSDYSLWKIVKNVKKPTQQNVPIKSADGSWLRRDKDKAVAFAIHLANTFKPHESTNELTFSEVTQEDVTITPFTTRDVEYEINHGLKPNKSPGFDLITTEVLRRLPLKAVIKLTDIMNACIVLKHVPTIWKTSEVIMIPKPGKDPYNVSSYRPISLLPMLSKLFEKLFIKRLKVIVQAKNLIPNHQFGFREEHSTLEQVHRITSIIEEALECKKVCSAVFLDVAQAFDKVWHEGLIQKLKEILPKQFTDIIHSYLEYRYFRVKIADEYTNLYPVEAGVPQGSILGPLLYVLYTSDIPIPDSGTIATFADDTCILATGNDEIESTRHLQEYINRVAEWTFQWRIKLNESKSTHIDFTNKNILHHPINIFGSTIPYSNNAKYLGMTLDVKLKWKEHVKKKVEELNIKYRKIKWLIGKKSNLTIENKILVYNQTIKPIWSYGIQLWGCACKKQINKIQNIQNNILRNIVDAPWYIRNDDLHRDLGLKTVKDTISLHAKCHIEKLQKHRNPEAIALTDVTRCTRRLKRKKPHDLINSNT